MLPRHQPATYVVASTSRESSTASKQVWENDGLVASKGGPMYSLRLRAGVCAVVLSIVHAAAAGAAVFTGPFDYSAGTNPVSIALGDIDGDGDPDLVTCQNYNEGLVTILLNDGAGAFREAPGSPLRGIGFPLSAEFGQFNPSVDRNLDL